jgi:hypothetical protein
MTKLIKRKDAEKQQQKEQIKEHQANAKVIDKAAIISARKNKQNNADVNSENSSLTSAPEYMSDTMKFISDRNNSAKISNESSLLTTHKELYAIDENSAYANQQLQKLSKLKNL